MPVDTRYVFVHIPKTGGQSIESLMGLDPYRQDEAHLTGCGDRRQPQLSHLTAREIKQRGEFADRRWFTVVRNPWERAVSEYAWCMTHGGRFPYLAGTPTFVEFVRFLAATPTPWPPTNELRHVMPQADFVCDEHGALLVEEIFDFADLDVLGPRLFDRPTPCINASPHEPFWSYYNAETEALILARYAQDVLLSRALSPSRIR